MGLLDAFNTDEGRLGLGLLAAAGPRSDGAGFGQRLSEGIGSVDAWKKQAMEKKLLEAHMGQYLADAAHKKQQDEQQKAKLEMLQGIFGGAPTSPGAFTPSLGGMGPTMPPQMQGQPSGGIGGMNIDTIAKLKALGGVDLMKEFEWANNPQKFDPGSMYRDRLTGAERTIPKLGEGVTVGPNGASEVPNYGNVIAGMEGAKAGAVEAAKSRFDPTQYTPAGQSNPVQSTRFNDVQRITGAQAPMPRSGLPPVAGVSGSFTGPAEDVLRSIENIRDPQERANAYAAYGSQSLDGNRLQSEAEKTKLVDTAKADVVRDTAKITDAKRYGQITETTNRALELLNSGPTGSGFGSLVDSGVGFFGASTKSADIASKLETLGGWMTANVPRMEGPQSDKDTAQYRIMAAQVGDRKVPIPQRIEAAKELQFLQNKYAELNGIPTKNDAPKAMPLPKGATAQTLKKGGLYELPNGSTGVWDGMRFKGQ